MHSARSVRPPVSCRAHRTIADNSAPQPRSAFATFALAAALTLGTGAHAQNKAPQDNSAELKIGNLAPYSGPASAYSTFAKAEAAYIRMLNEKGGINGRKINFISYDDAYSPPKAVEQARKLVEDDGVLAIFQSVGTPPNAAIMKYMNVKKVPQLLAATGATKFGDPKNFPWTMGFSTSVYRVESGIYAKYILQNHPNAKVAVLYANDDYGKDIYKGFKDALGARTSMIVAEAPYDSSDATVDSQITRLRASNADIMVNFSTPRFAAQAIRKMAEMGWKPLHILNTTASSIPSVFRPAGIENAVGIITAHSSKDPGDPRWKDDPGVLEFRAFMDKYYPEGDKDNGHNAYGYLAAQTLEQVLKQCGDDFSRENIMKQAANLKSVSFGLLLPGVTINTSPTNYFPITQMQLVRFTGDGWENVGGVMTEQVAAE